MTTIHLSTKIKASKQVIFDLSRNIDIHKLSTAKSNETAIDGVTSGLINVNETVTWRGKHFGFYLTHKSIISAMNLMIILWMKWSKENLNRSNTSIPSSMEMDL